MDLSREAEAGHANERAHTASGMVLLTLASAQFLAVAAGPLIGGLLAVIALIALFFSRRIPTRQPSAAPASESVA